MVLTRNFRETIQARAKKDPAYREAMLTEAVDSFLSGDMDVGKALLRDYIKATVGFETISRQINKPSKSLHRMLSPSSTGGIMALGFARDDGNGKPRYTAKDLAGIYQTRGKQVFSRSLWKGAVFLGSRYVRMQTSLAVASDDMDNATSGNVENLIKAEAGKLIMKKHVKSNP